jgi:FMN phosphatase YigB (HAD superfamily)
MGKCQRLVTFDAFNTLFHVSPSPVEIYARIAREHGVAADTQLLKTAFSQSFKAQNKAFPNFGAAHSIIAKDWWKTVVFDTFTSASSPSRLTERVLEPLFDDIYAYFSLSDAFKLYPETLEVLDRLKSRDSMTLGVISNSDRRTGTLCMRS